VAARDARGQLWLALTNIDPNRPARIVLDVAGLKVASASGQTLTAPTIDAINTFDAPERVSPKPYRATARDGKLVLDLAKQSVTMVALQP
jgi:alpha-N-arabinofuranosidase